MSICRWSCDNLRSDVYIYECEGGYSVNVRDVHPVNAEVLGKVNFYANLLMKVQLNEQEEIQRLVKEHKENVQKLKYEPLDSPYAGKSFSLDTLEDLHELVVRLEDSGVYVLQKVFDYIEEES